MLVFFFFPPHRKYLNLAKAIWFFHLQGPQASLLNIVQNKT